VKVNYATWQEKEKAEENAINYLSSDWDKRVRSYYYKLVVKDGR